MKTDRKTIYQVDAFTDEVFKGNPAGVMIVDDKVEDNWMQNIAMEMNLSETSFVIPDENEFRIRYFTPTNEINLCGHATLASSHILYELGIVNPNDIICFKANTSNLSVTKNSNLIVMNFPVYSLNRIDIPTDFKKIVGFEPVEMFSSNDEWIVAIAGSKEEIIDAQPKFELMASAGLGHLMITAKNDSRDSDFVVRCFAPSSGINEDPVTGSAHCALTPLWTEKLGKTEMDSLQLSKRTGKLKVKLLGDRVEIKGKAVTVFEAKLKD